MNSAPTLLQFVYLLTLVYLTSPIAFGQATPPSNWRTQVTDLLEAAVPADQAGVAVSIAFAEEEVFAHSRGFSNIENHIPLQPRSRFKVGDLCNQFIAFAVLRLVDQGRIDLEAEIQEYLPEFPRYQHPVRVKHLLSHTHGLPNASNLQLLAGWGLGDQITTSELLALVSGHRSMAFLPGTEFNYDNTGFILASQIIETLSGVEFTRYMTDSLFLPLGMNNTYYSNSSASIDPLRTTLYISGNDAYRYGRLIYHQLPSSSFYSTTEDLARWGAFINTAPPAYASIIQAFNEEVETTLESQLSFTKGQFIEDYRGLQRYYQMGLAYGNMSYFCRFPAEELTVVVLSNDIEFRAYPLADQIIDLLLADKFAAPEESSTTLPTAPSTLSESVIVPSEILDSYLGDYWESEAMYARSIYLKNDTLYYSRGVGQDNPLIPINDTLFVLGNTGNNHLTLSFSNDQMELIVNEASDYHFDPFTAPELSNEELELFTGKYHNSGLGISYEIIQEENQLVLQHPRLGRIALKPYQKNHFITDRWYLPQLRFLLTRGGEVAFAEVSSADLRGVLIHPVSN